MKHFFSTLSVIGLAGLGASLSHSTGTPPAARAAETYKIDVAHSFVQFHTKHVGISQAYGRFDRILEKSELGFDAKNPAQSSILVVVDASSIDTNNKNRDEHLSSPDFFSVKEFPEIVFESKKISAKGEDLEVTGDLSFHGVTKSITAKAKVVGQGEVAMFKDYRVGLVAEFQVDMRDFGVDFVKKNPGAVGPEVALTVSLECSREGKSKQ